ncbi:Galanin receptor type 1 [Desmophyllum pertusum]|uniref:Galanin receptor type 1 n=1 Tax=Desmophyllum pertusum TaxID=174260 RepID=A0A9X0A549_9CNID|nr:Galanin receptor type 1 [Desmophyllum pertusum]
MSASVNLSSNASDDVGASSNNTSLRQNCPLTGVFVRLSQVSIAIHAITLLASLVGNTFLIAVFVRIKEPIMLPIANMAVSDLLVAIFLIPRLIARDVIGSNAFLVQGNGGLFLCKMCTFLSDISLSVSTLSLVLIAVERFLAVVYPMVYKKITVKVRRFLVASTWIMAMAFHSPYFYTMRLVANANHQVCQSSWNQLSITVQRTFAIT